MKKLSIVGLFLLSVLNSHGATILSEDFQSYTSGSALTTGATWTRATNYSGYNSVTVETDTSNLFGLGTSNQYLRLYQYAAVTSNPVNAVASISGMSDVGQVSFNFEVPNATYTSGITLRIGNGNSSGNTAFALYFTSGSTSGKLYSTTGASLSTSTQLSTFTYGQSYQLTIVYNNSASSYTYSNGTVAAYTMDVWLGSTLIGNDLAQSGGLANTGTSLSSVNFISLSNSTIFDLSIDNLTVQSIPETSTILYLISGFCLLSIFQAKYPSRAKKLFNVFPSIPIYFIK